MGWNGWVLNVLFCLGSLFYFVLSCYGSTALTQKTWHFVQTRHMRTGSRIETAAGRPAGDGSLSAHQCFCALQRRGTSSPSPSTRGQLVGRVGAADRARGVCGCRISKCIFYKHTMLVGAAQALGAETFTLSGQQWLVSSGDEH